MRIGHYSTCNSQPASETVLNNYIFVKFNKNAKFVTVYYVDFFRFFLGRREPLLFWLFF